MLRYQGFRGQGFTLIELLVVVAVITILAGSLLPVFAQARARARQAHCSSNTRQLALGLLMYIQDHDDTLPPVAYLPARATTDDNAVLWPDLVTPYLNNHQVRRCPQDGRAKENSYGLNELAFADLTDTEGPRVPVRALAVFQSPTTTVMLGEVGTGDDLTINRSDCYKLVAPSYPLNDEADARPAARHFERANLAFMDGHQTSMRLDQFYLRQTPPDRWFLP